MVAQTGFIQESLHQRAPRWPLAVVRIFLGVAFVRAATNKIGANWAPWPGWMESGLRSRLHEMIPPYRLFIESVVMPNISAFAHAIGVAELLVGVALVTGFSTRLAAAGGIFLVANYFLNKGEFFLAPVNDVAFMVSLALVIAGHAGRSLGIDALAVRRWPRTPLW